MDNLLRPGQAAEATAAATAKAAEAGRVVPLKKRLSLRKFYNGKEAVVTCRASAEWVARYSMNNWPTTNMTPANVIANIALAS